jgi:hypothetical protein
MVLGTAQFPVEWMSVLFAWRLNGRDVRQTTHPHVRSRIRIILHFISELAQEQLRL